MLSVVFRAQMFEKFTPFYQPFFFMELVFKICSRNISLKYREKNHRLNSIHHQRKSRYPMFIQTSIEYGIFEGGSQISTNQTRERNVF